MAAQPRKTHRKLVVGLLVLVAIVAASAVALNYRTVAAMVQGTIPAPASSVSLQSAGSSNLAQNATQNGGSRRQSASSGAAPSSGATDPAASTALQTTANTAGSSPASAPAAAPAAAPSFVAKATGSLISANQATLAFQSPGRIKDVKVQEGDKVKAGEVIATLDVAALDAQVTQAQANLDSAIANLDKVKAGPTKDDTIVAKSNVDRAKAALDQAQAAYDKIGGASNPSIGMSQQSVNLQQAYSAYQSALSSYNLTIDHPTDAELKAAEASVAQAQAALEVAKQNAANARITAPVDGTVVWVGNKLGESAVAGSPEIIIADLSKMQIQVSADELSGGALQVGQAVSITLDSLPNKTLNGHISKLGLLASSSGGIISIPVTVDIDPTNTPIYPGLGATVQFQGAGQ